MKSLLVSFCLILADINPQLNRLKSSAFSPIALPLPTSRRCRNPSSSTALALQRFFDQAKKSLIPDFLNSRSRNQRNRDEEGYYGEYGPGYDEYDERYGYGYDGGNRFGKLFGNGEYYNDSSEDFRRVSSGDRYQRPTDLRYDWEFRDNFGYPYFHDDGSWRSSEDFRRSSRGLYGGGGAGSSQFGGRRLRAGDINARMQDYYSPRERELYQQRDNEGARYGWQQQYNTDRGNVRNGSSSDFRRGRSYNTFRTFSTPKERELRQMQDNRMISRVQQGIGGERQFRNDNRYWRRGRSEGQRGYKEDFEYDGRENLYATEIFDRNDENWSRRATGRKLRNSWGKGFFNTGF